MTPRCPRCESRECAPCDVLLEGSGETIRATHECSKCCTRFKFTPPARPAKEHSMTRWTRNIGLIALAVVIALPLLALAQTLPDPAQTDAFLDTLIRAIAAGDWRYVAVLAVIGLTALVRRFGPSIPVVGPYLVSSRAGAITALVFALVTGLAPPILGWVPWSVRVVLDVLLAGFASIGGWVGVRRIVGVVPASSGATVVTLNPNP